MTDPTSEMTSSQRRKNVMTNARLLIGVIGAILVFLSVHPTTAQIDPRMPEGPNRELVARKCTSCHDVSNFVGTAGRSRAGWDVKIEDMVVLYGMRITPEERALVLEYLATYLPP
jgi:hypothetical protein